MSLVGHLAQEAEAEPLGGRDEAVAAKVADDEEDDGGAGSDDVLAPPGDAEREDLGA